jgi:site-specific DNA-methyltransferase (adenine-specific)
MGSGTTMVACQNTNRNGIGIEMDDNYFKIAEKRINKIIKK